MSGSSTRRTTIVKRRAGKTARLIFFAKRAGIVFGAVAAVFYGGFAAFHSQWFERLETRVSESFHIRMAGAGFQVSALLIDGRQFTDRDELKNMLQIEKDASIFSYDPKLLQEKIQGLPWVRNAVVERRLPETIYVRLDEKTPVALWQKDGRLSLIDSEGEIIPEKNIAQFMTLLVVTGDGAPKHAPDLIGMLRAEPEIASRIDIARRIGNRRWDIRLKNNIVIRLPEDDAGLALRKLSDAQAREKILDRMVEAIDLRDDGRIVIQTEPGAADKYDAGFKKEKNI